MTPMTTTAPSITRPRARTARLSRKTGLAPYMFIAPFYVLNGLFLIIPVIAALYLSLT
jgi:multiple sugar transport system permease protein